MSLMISDKLSAINAPSPIGGYEGSSPDIDAESVLFNMRGVDGR